MHKIVNDELNKKVCIVNAHWSNRGDEAAITALIYKIFECCPSAVVLILFKDKKEISQKITIAGREIEHKSIQFLPNEIDYFFQLFSNGIIGHDKKLNECISCIKSSDYIIYAPGGSVINDCFWWRKQLEYLLPFFYHIVWHKKLYVASPSLGPFYKRYHYRNIVRRIAFKSVNNLYVRENISYEYLKQIDAEKKATVTVDTAFCRDIDPKIQSQLLSVDRPLSDFISKYNKVIGMTITELDWNIRYNGQKGFSEKIYTATSDFIQKLNSSGIGVVLIPQLFGNQDDFELLKKYTSQNTYILDNKYDSDFQQYLISKLYMLVGFRYHSCIFAAKAGTPFVPVIYEEKLEGFVDQAELHDCAIEINDISSDMLMSKYIFICDNYKFMKSRLYLLHEIWMKKADIICSSLKEFLN